MLRIRLGLALLTLATPALPGELAWVEDVDGHLAVRLELPITPAPREVDWPAVLTAHVGLCADRDSTPPMLAGVEIAAKGVWLRPRFELDPAADYCAVFDPSSLAQPNGNADPVLVQWIGHSPGQPPRAVRILPAVDTLPANALRLYVEFSRPHFARDVHRWIRLRDETRGAWVEEPFVAVPEGLWDADRRRLTLIFHPGRIKRSVGPNLAMGPPLEAGHRYRLMIEVPGGLPTSFEFTASGDDRQVVDPERWRLHSPPSPTDPLRVVFDEPLDPYLAERWIWVETAAGVAVPTIASASADGVALNLTPRQPWPPTALDLVVDSRLEDLAGNRVQQLFEREISAAAMGETAEAQPPLRLRIGN